MKSPRILSSDIGQSPFEAVIEMPDAAFQALPAGAYVFLADGTLVRFNRHAADLWGFAPEIRDRQKVFCGHGHLLAMSGDLLSWEETPMAEALRQGRPVYDREAIIERPDGSQVAAAFNVEPLRNAAAHIEGGLCCFHEIAQRKETEAGLRARLDTESNRRMDEQLALYNFTSALQHVRSLSEVYEAALDAIYGALRCDRASILLFDDEGVMRFVAWRDLAEGYRCAVDGHSPWTRESTDAQPISVKDIDETAESEWLKQTIRKEGIRGLAFLPILARGKVIGKFTVYYDRPHAFSAPEIGVASTIARQVGFAIERIRTEEARDALLADSLRLAAIVESSDDAIISKDLNGIIASWNKGAERLFGYRAEEVVGKPVTILMPPERVTEEPAILARIRSGERMDHYETVRRRKDGTLLDISLTISPVKDGTGRIVGASKIARDITEKKRMEQQRDLMVAELSHRVKNTLATVISIARQSFAHPDAAQASSSFEARIRALAQTHSRLAESNWSGVPLQTLLSDECAPYQREDGDNVRLSGPDVFLNARAALSLGLAIHELVTNAAKYGALSIKNGVVDLAWSIKPEEQLLCLHWRESGGPPVAPPPRSGFGRLLLQRALASDLGGRVKTEFLPAGLRCTISLPLKEIVAAMP